MRFKISNGNSRKLTSSVSTLSMYKLSPYSHGVGFSPHAILGWFGITISVKKYADPGYQYHYQYHYHYQTSIMKIFGNSLAREIISISLLILCASTVGTWSWTAPPRESFLVFFFFRSCSSGSVDVIHVCHAWFSFTLWKAYWFLVEICELHKHYDDRSSPVKHEDLLLKISFDSWRRL